MKSKTLSPPNYYISLRSEPSHAPAAIQVAIQTSLLSVYGVVGSASLHFENIGKTNIILRVPSEQYRRIWAAIALVTNVQGRPTSIRVVGVTPFLFAIPDGRTELL